MGQVTGGSMGLGFALFALSQTLVRRKWRNGTRINGKGEEVRTQPKRKAVSEADRPQISMRLSQGQGKTEQAEFLRVHDCGL